MGWAGSHALRWPCVNLLYVFVLLWTRRTDGLADFSNYLSRIITSHSAHACDGQALRLFCPRHSTISVRSAFYGRGDAAFCSSGPRATDAGADKHSCSTLTALQKLVSECQAVRSCQLPVNHLVFGGDPCPGTRKYLHVTYMCKPTEHKTHVVCEGERLVLRCRPPRILLVYAAVYGRGRGQEDTCPAHLSRPPPFDCLNNEAVHTVSQACSGRRRCDITVDSHAFRDPCFPGNRKYLTVLYSCVPQTLLRMAAPGLLRSTPPPEGGVPQTSPGDPAPRPELSRRPPGAAVMSGSLMTYGYIKEHPETAALLFTSSVCVGLLLILLAVSVRVTCRGRSGAHPRPEDETLPSQTPSRRRRQDEEDEEDEETDCSSLSEADRKPGYCWEEVAYTTEACERVERMERRELVVQEIWMNAYLNGTHS